MHRSRLGTIVIDCQTDQLDAAGHRFCVVGPQRDDFATHANLWDAEPPT